MSRYLKKKKYSQLAVDCEVCGCKVKKNKWARHVGIWWGERVGRTVTTTIMIIHTSGFLCSNNSDKCWWTSQLFPKVFRILRSRLRAVSHLLSAGPGCSFTGFHGTRRCESLWGEGETITSLKRKSSVSDCMVSHNHNSLNVLTAQYCTNSSFYCLIDNQVDRGLMFVLF